ncbi:CBS domain-containing protein [Pseudonocardia sp.]|uniref:CBS domain-containing protein n=1 Tax=Pseudonocardia sp. TaxID=60912 RepID=UPI00345D2396
MVLLPSLGAREAAPLDGAAGRGKGGRMRVCDVPVMPVNGPDSVGSHTLLAHPQHELSEVITVLRLTGLRSLPVVDDGVLLGTVSERDLIRALARDDVDIGHDIRCRLARNLGLGRWLVTVRGGDVVLAGHEPDPVDGEAVTSIANSVIGVTDVRFAHAAHARSRQSRRVPRAASRCATGPRNGELEP